MVAKRSSRAAALLLMLPSAAFALGFGDIRLLSPLNAPLDAQIELSDVTPEELQTLQAQIASRETFARQGLEWPVFLSSVKVKTAQSSDGHTVISLKSTDPITEPFITLLIEVDWAHGHLLREYTMLLDPPVYTPGQTAASNAPVTAPAAGAGTREGAIARGAEASPPASSAPAPGSSVAGASSATASADSSSAGSDTSAPATSRHKGHPRTAKAVRPPRLMRERALPVTPTSCSVARRCRRSPRVPLGRKRTPPKRIVGCWLFSSPTRAPSNRI